MRNKFVLNRLCSSKCGTIQTPKGHSKDTLNHHLLPNYN